eukprot:TRINITY_DN61974_c0_g1_i1.p1 TRINITY_DN61974_c0_g1~~TRINITY_DN61974_c0_g1_i1.p1  ORF type:complete len:550 (-),score=88.97 TRINITY_DN61974_c0_g1_i1:1577-3226(-)
MTLYKLTPINCATAFTGLKGVPLLKKIEQTTADLFIKNVIPAAASPEKQELIKRACLNQNYEGVEEFTPEFFELLDLAVQRQNLTQTLVQQAMQDCDHGWSAFDSKLIFHSCEISRAYAPFYLSWLKAVQGNEVAKKLTNTPPPKEMENHYTIISLDDAGNYKHTAYGAYFKDELAPVVEGFTKMIGELKGIPDRTDNQNATISFLEQYLATLTETNVDKLEEMNKTLDEKWMDVKGPIQVLHDIETGYGDPLRTKAIPDFSLRFEDADYQKNNETIREIQGKMVEYFKTRDSPICKSGLHALGASHAAIFYIPFQTGMSLHFRFSGQSIPNRSDVKEAKGVKIFFDAISTGFRMEQAADLARKVIAEDQIEAAVKSLDAVNCLTWAVAGHEVGHAIYNLETLKGVISPAVQSELEEPRAELTALHTMKLLLNCGMMTQQQLEAELTSFAVHDLRRFAMFDSSALRPYTISAINTFKLYQETGFMSLVDDKIKFDFSKATAAIEALSKQFEEILDAEDANDGKKIEEVHKQFGEMNAFTDWVVSKLFKK